MDLKLPETRFYFERFGFCKRQIVEPPQSDMGMVLVIPCYNEPDVISALESLWSCAQPKAAVEVIIVVNSPIGADAAVLAQNETTLAGSSRWITAHEAPRFRFHLVHVPNLPRKKAGVGLARKIGMDEALRRFDPIGRKDGVIACFDADCECDPNYLCELERFFSEYRDSPGCSIYFEHPLQTGETPLERAVIEYELHLRCYVQGLRYAGFPHAFHTIGSSMAVRADDYLKQGGMNKRQAGEDFYFLHKIIPLGGFGDLTTTRVLPSGRASERVPFGTGRAVADYLRTERLSSYPFQAFEDLRIFFASVGGLRSGSRSPKLPSPALQSYLDQPNFSAVLDELRVNTAMPATFERRFFRWFDGFQAMKFIHHARDHFYGSEHLAVLARKLWRAMTGEERDLSAREFLEGFRQWERTHPKLPA